jgi:hypothetical protein
MFETRKSFSDRLAHAVDLTIDFATLGEYGLEPVDARPRACEARPRRRSTRGTGAWSAAVNRFATHP